MSAFVAVARAGSFAGAARWLGRSTTTVSRQVADLEGALGAALLRRTTRHVSPTEAGARLLPRATAILDEIERLRGDISGDEAAPRGLLRITAPSAIGRELIAPLAVDFLRAHPEIDLDLSLTERVVDLVGEGYDAALRAGILPDSSLVTRRIADLGYRLCASPAYVDARGLPAVPGELDRHDCLSWRTGDGTAAAVAWRLRRDGVEAPPPGRFRLTVPDMASLRVAVLRGLGLALLPDTDDLRAALAAGRLVEALPDWRPASSPISLVRPPLPFEPARLRVFIDFATAALRARLRR